MLLEKLCERLVHISDSLCSCVPLPRWQGQDVRTKPYNNKNIYTDNHGGTIKSLGLGLASVSITQIYSSTSMLLRSTSTSIIIMLVIIIYQSCK